MDDAVNDAPEPRLDISGARLFASWLRQHDASLAFTTYQAGKLFLIGLKPDGALSVFERTFDRAMGLAVAPGRIFMGSLYQLWRLDDFLAPGETHQGHDALFVPTVGHTTGDIDIHDVEVDRDGAPVFVATRFNCLAGIAERGSFRVVWKPPFIDRIAAEDRCHLNGLAMEDGRPRYVTCVSRSNVAEGWREDRRDGGIVVDVPSGEIVAGGLSMPHSPRVHRGRLWLVQAGTGEFGAVDPASGRFEPVCFLPGFARGIDFRGDYAVIGLSRPRQEGAFSGLVLDERLAREGVGAKCAVCVVNLLTGDVEHRLDISGVVRELFDVAVIPGVRRPMALGFRTDEIRFAIRHK